MVNTTDTHPCFSVISVCLPMAYVHVYISLYIDLSWPFHFVSALLSTPMGVDYVVIGSDMEVQPLVTHDAA